MASPYQQLMDAIVATGVTEDEARYAAGRCAGAMAKQGVFAYAGAGAFAYFLAMNPATVLPVVATGAALGAGHALLRAPQCSEVRDAIRFWATASF